MDKHSHADRRKFIRLRWVFPVEFRLLDPQTGEPISDFMQGFTADVSKGGILLRANCLKPEFITMLQKKDAKLSVNINIHFGYKPVKAIAAIAWIRVVKEYGRDRCLIGLSFDKIGKRARRRFMGYAASIYWGPRLTMITLAFLVVALGLERITEIKLTKENTILVERLADVLEARNQIVDLLDKTDVEKVTLLSQIEEQREKIDKIEDEREKLLKQEKELKAEVVDVRVYKEELAKTQTIKGVLEAQLKTLSDDKQMLQKDLDLINRRAEKRMRELKRIESMRTKLEKKTVDKMYDWLLLHQNRKTKLIPSYEGDILLKNMAFTYDQSLAAQAFLLYGDVDNAEDILNFFKYNAPRRKGIFVNAYDVNTGTVAETEIHVGPNIWLGIAFMQHIDMVGSNEYLNTAKDIADWVIKIQSEDQDGGIRGGPNVTWFSTEHNLDAYAFFTMLAKKTDMDKYKRAADKALKWIKRNAFTESGRIYRGKGDATIATDTFSWAIAALGPKTLMDVGMDPQAIMDFAEKHCQVTVKYERPDGKVVEVTGFDFAKTKHMPRGGIVSTEWTAQMIVSIRIMRDFYGKIDELKKAYAYRRKYIFYLSQLEQLIISSPSRIGQGAGCLPTATQDNADTGHGWRTPKGKYTGSVSGTAYGIFAIKGYNPMELSSEQ
jgi:hypothetical protein